jgi:hypothetical protein
MLQNRLLLARSTISTLMGKKEPNMILGWIEVVQPFLGVEKTGTKVIGLSRPRLETPINGRPKAKGGDIVFDGGKRSGTDIPYVDHLRRKAITGQILVSGFLATSHVTAAAFVRIWRFSDPREFGADLVDVE